MGDGCDLLVDCACYTGAQARLLLPLIRNVGSAVMISSKAVYVDEYQDTDPSQVRLLGAIGGDGRDLVVVGDPDQSIYAFRGADVRGILEFPTQFPQADGSPADVVALSTTRRFGERLLTVSSWDELLADES